MEQAIKIQFYHLTATALEAAVPQLVAKALQAGLRGVLWCDDTDAARLSDALWHAKPEESFLAHGLAGQAYAAWQPLLISGVETQENAPDMLMITHGKMPEDITRYRRILDIFNGADEHAVAAARSRWQEYKTQGHALQYFKQNPSGGWELAG